MPWLISNMTVNYHKGWSWDDENIIIHVIIEQKKQFCHMQIEYDALKPKNALFDYHLKLTVHLTFYQTDYHPSG